MIPCSPTCDQVYRLTDRNDVSGKTIHEHCKLNTSVGKYYHDIANRTMFVVQVAKRKVHETLVHANQDTEYRYTI